MLLWYPTLCSTLNGMKVVLLSSETKAWVISNSVKCLHFRTHLKFIRMNQRDDDNADDGDGIKPPPMHRMSWQGKEGVCGQEGPGERRWYRQKATTSYDVDAEELWRGQCTKTGRFKNIVRVGVVQLCVHRKLNMLLFCTPPVSGKVALLFSWFTPDAVHIRFGRVGWLCGCVGDELRMGL